MSMEKLKITDLDTEHFYESDAPDSRYCIVHPSDVEQYLGDEFTYDEYMDACDKVIKEKGYNV